MYYAYFFTNVLSQLRSGSIGLKQSQVYPPKYGKAMAKHFVEYKVWSLRASLFLFWTRLKEHHHPKATAKRDCPLRTALNNINFDDNKMGLQAGIKITPDPHTPSKCVRGTICMAPCGLGWCQAIPGTGIPRWTLPASVQGWFGFEAASNENGSENGALI